MKCPFHTALKNLGISFHKLPSFCRNNFIQALLVPAPQNKKWVCRIFEMPISFHKLPSSQTRNGSQQPLYLYKQLSAPVFSLSVSQTALSKCDKVNLPDTFVMMWIVLFLLSYDLNCLLSVVSDL